MFERMFLLSTAFFMLDINKTNNYGHTLKNKYSLSVYKHIAILEGLGVLEKRSIGSRNILVFTPEGRELVNQFHVVLQKLKRLEKKYLVRQAGLATTADS